MKALWASSPASHSGPFFSFEDVYCEPSPLRPEGPLLWFGGQHMHARLLDRLSRFGSGFHPFGPPTAEDRRLLAAALAERGRSLDELELIGGTRATFTAADDLADLDQSMEDLPAQVAAGYTTFCMKPSQHTNDPEEVESLVRQMVSRLREI